MNFQLLDGVWPTMITPFTENGDIDWKALDALIEWYVSKGVDGLFAVCQSSEMFYLTLGERNSLGKYVVEKVDGRCGVIVSGHISDSFDDQVEELNRACDSGADAVVLVVNRLAKQDEDSKAWIRNMEAILDRINPDVPLGLYECPYPYKRLLGDQEVRWLSDSGRFYFLKDTSCDPKIQRKRIKIAGDSGFKLFNANSATLLSSLKMGYSGFCGVMGNFHPELYSALLTMKDEAEAIELNEFLGFSSILEYQAYPVNAKYFFSLEGIPLTMKTRNPSAKPLSSSMKTEIEQFRCYSRRLSERLPEVRHD